MSDDTIRPAMPAANLQSAMHLAKTGRRSEALEVLRRVVAAQPEHQAAWIWLSAVAPDKTEAEAALDRVKALNPAHPRLAQAELWLAQRFPPEPLAAPTPETKAAPAPPPVPGHPPSSAGSKPLEFLAAINRFGLLKYGLGGLVIAAAAGVGFFALLVGLLINATAQAQPNWIPGEPREEMVVFEEAAADPGSELNLAWKGRQWGKVISILEKLYQGQPTSKNLKEQLAHAYIQQGTALRHKGYIEEALPYFKQALVLAPKDLRAQRELRLASDYLEGIQLYQDGQWPRVIDILQPVWREDSEYVNVNDLLYSAYYNHGLARQAAGKLSQARDAFKAAINLRPDLVEPRQEMAEIEFALAPETEPDIPIPAVPPKDQLIVVGILEQRMWVYEGKRRVFDFVVSTGEPGRDTAIGDFEILDKIEMAYASTWNLDMPYWMGIYWSGPLENGIHSLPIVRHTGYKLWDGYLGQRVSYGCVILGDEDAATLFDWTQVGAKVKIVYSLAEWSSEE